MKSFALFLTVFIGIYSLMHVYAYIKLRLIVPFGRRWSLFIIPAFIALLLSPIMGQVLVSRGFERFALPVLFAGNEWMGFVFLFISAQFFGDCLRLLLALTSRIVPGLVPALWRRARLARPVAVAAGSTAIIALIYGHFEANRLQVHEVEFYSEKLPAGVESLRVAQVSDMHFSPLKGLRLARRVVDLIEEVAPDMLVSTGDLVDRGMADAREIARKIRSIETPLGKYAVMGNHEFYGNGIETSVDFHKRAGFQVLRGEKAAPVPWLSVVGVDDEAAHDFGGPQGLPIQEILSGMPPKNLVIILRHRPIVEEDLPGRFDIQLSGHTHGGQVFPFNFFVALVYPHVRGEYYLGKGSMLHVNRGTGTWGPSLRVGSPPEVTLVHIRPKP